MPPARRFCIRGHDTWETGRFRNRTCRACWNTGQPRGRPAVTHCVNGHEIAVVGRTGNGTCRACQRAASNQYRERKSGGVSALRLRAYIRDSVGVRRAMELYAGRYDTTIDAAKRAWCRLGESRCSLATADRWCVAIGSHIDIVYPELRMVPA